jgi:hypothetical protein
VRVKNKRERSVRDRDLCGDEAVLGSRTRRRWSGRSGRFISLLESGVAVVARVAVALCEPLYLEGRDQDLQRGGGVRKVKAEGKSTVGDTAGSAWLMS